VRAGRRCFCIARPLYRIAQRTYFLSLIQAQDLRSTTHRYEQLINLHPSLQATDLLSLHTGPRLASDRICLLPLLRSTPSIPRTIYSLRRTPPCRRLRPSTVGSMMLPDSSRDPLSTRSPRRTRIDVAPPVVCRRRAAIRRPRFLYPRIFILRLKQAHKCHLRHRSKAMPTPHIIPDPFTNEECRLRFQARRGTRA
jgi:hypothetical protein